MAVSFETYRAKREIGGKLFHGTVADFQTVAATIVQDVNQHELGEKLVTLTANRDAFAEVTQHFTAEETTVLEAAVQTINAL